MGKLIIIEGLDGCGKSTQTALLEKYLDDKSISFKKIKLPDYDSPSSTLVNMYLGGEFGSNANDVNAYAASAFYAVDRFASFKLKWKKEYDNGELILADRYATSNLIYQMEKIPADCWDEYIEWSEDFEYEKIGIPAPDAVVYLRVDPTLSQKLMTGRYHGDESKKDIHEKDLDYLARSRAAAEHCAEAFGWRVVECEQGGEMKSVESIAQAVLHALQDLV